MTSFLLSKKLNVIHRCLFLAFDDFARISLSHKFVLPLAGPAMFGAFFRWLEAWPNSRLMHEFAQAPGRIKIKDWEAGLFALLSSLTILPYQPLKWILRGGNTHQALSQVLWDFGTGFPLSERGTGFFVEIETKFLKFYLLTCSRKRQI